MLEGKVGAKVQNIRKTMQTQIWQASSPDACHIL